MMYDDIAASMALYAGLMPCFLTIMLGGADAMPKEKQEFTYKVFMPKVLLRCAMRLAVTASPQAARAPAVGGSIAAGYHQPRHSRSEIAWPDRSTL